MNLNERNTQCIHQFVATQRINNVDRIPSSFSFTSTRWMDLLERDPPSILEAFRSFGVAKKSATAIGAFGQACVALVGGRECPVRDPPSSPWAERQYPSCDTLATTLGSVSPGLHRGVNALAWPRLRIDLHSLHCWQPPPPSQGGSSHSWIFQLCCVLQGGGKNGKGIDRDSFWAFFGMKRNHPFIRCVTHQGFRKIYFPTSLCGDSL